MTKHSLDPELRPSLAKAMLDSLEHLLSVAPPDATIPFRHIGAQVTVLKSLCPCGTEPADCRKKKR